MNMSEPEESKRYHVSDGIDVRSSVHVDTYDFKWTVEKLSKLLPGGTLTSPVFIPLPGRKWHAKLEKHVKDTSTYAGDHKFFTLSFSQTIGSEVGLKFLLFIMDNNNKTIYESFKSCVFDNGYNSTAFVIEGDVEKERECMKASNEVLIFACSIELYGYKLETDTFQHFPKQKSSFKNLVELSNNLKSMYDMFLYTDVTLKAGGSIIRAHKSILCARSPVFANILQTKMGETEASVIEIDDLELPVLKNLIAFMYTGTLDEADFEALYHLYYAADKYDVSSLRSSCSALLLSKLQMNNACRLLVLADKHNDSNFKNSVMKFIAFYFDRVLLTDGWDELAVNTTRLAVEVMNLHGKKRRKGIELLYCIGIVMSLSVILLLFWHLFVFLELFE